MANDRPIEIRDIQSLRESLTRFYGRAIRRLEADVGTGRTFVVTDVLFGYDGCKRMLAELSGQSVVTDADPLRLKKVRRMWEERHANFLASDDPIRFHSNTPFIVCIILLFVVDGLFNIICQALLTANGREDWIVYQSSVSLIVSRSDDPLPVLLHVHGRLYEPRESSVGALMVGQTVDGDDDLCPDALPSRDDVLSYHLNRISLTLRTALIPPDNWSALWWGRGDA